jgi:hypothetical protein
MCNHYISYGRNKELSMGCPAAAYCCITEELYDDAADDEFNGYSYLDITDEMLREPVGPRYETVGR